jgi:hypothetical protein
MQSIEHDVFIAGFAASFFVNRYHAGACSSSRRQAYTQYLVQSLAEKQYNAVVVLSQGWKAKGYETKRPHTLDGRSYTILAARRFAGIMIVENCGAGGYENWAFSGTNWVRWDKIVKFFPAWDKDMGDPYETRPRWEFPGWEPVKYTDFCFPASFRLTRNLFGTSKGDLLVSPLQLQGNEDSSLQDSNVYCHGLSIVSSHGTSERTTAFEQTAATTSSSTISRKK